MGVHDAALDVAESACLHAMPCGFDHARPEIRRDEPAPGTEPLRREKACLARPRGELQHGLTRLRIELIDHPLRHVALALEQTIPVTLPRSSQIVGPLASLVGRVGRRHKETLPPLPVLTRDDLDPARARREHRGDQGVARHAEPSTQELCDDRVALRLSPAQHPLIRFGVAAITAIQLRTSSAPSAESTSSNATLPRVQRVFVVGTSCQRGPQARGPPVVHR